jgi:hypothetical protein
MWLTLYHYLVCAVTNIIDLNAQLLVIYLGCGASSQQTSRGPLISVKML